jgi:hypothetical protein
MNENPYAAPPDFDEPKQHSARSRVERVRAWRTWLLIFAGTVVGLCVIGWILAAWISMSKSDHLKIILHLAKWNSIANSMAALFFLPYLFVVYRMTRAMGRSHGRAIFHLILGTLSIFLGENTHAVVIPLGVFIATPILLSLAGEIIDNSQAKYQPIMPSHKELNEE